MNPSAGNWDWVEQAAALAGQIFSPKRPMGDETQIVAGGGWSTRQVRQRPKARFCVFLSVVWLIVVVGSLAFWNEAAGWHWLRIVAVIPEPVFLALALVFWMAEEPRLVTERRSKPGFDPSILY